MNDKAKYAIALGAFVIFTIIGYKMLPEEEIVIQTNQGEEKNKIYVHIEGCVYNPGIIEVEYGTRIYELIQLAGGETEDADLSKINLASIVQDEQKVNIPKRIEFEEKNTNNGYKNVSNVNASASKTLININMATIDELKNLSGVGEATAKRIIDYRETEGYFTNIEDIMNVSGIGESKFNKIKNYIEI